MLRVSSRSLLTRNNSFCYDFKNNNTSSISKYYYNIFCRDERIFLQPKFSFNLLRNTSASHLLTYSNKSIFINNNKNNLILHNNFSISCRCHYCSSSTYSTNTATTQRRNIIFHKNNNKNYHNNNNSDNINKNILNNNTLSHLDPHHHSYQHNNNNNCSCCNCNNNNNIIDSLSVFATAANSNFIDINSTEYAKINISDLRVTMATRPISATENHSNEPSGDRYRPLREYNTTNNSSTQNMGRSWASSSSSDNYNYAGNDANSSYNHTQHYNNSGYNQYASSNNSNLVGKNRLFSNNKSSYNSSYNTQNGTESSLSNSNRNRGMSARYNSSYADRNDNVNIDDIEIKKDFYVLHDELKNVTEEQVNEFRKQNGNIMVSSEDPSIKIPDPVVSFEQAFICDRKILDAIKSQNFHQPTHIQCQVWPIILSGHDTISISQTGSGKTLGFLLPGFVHAHKQPSTLLQSDEYNPSILVICPTRELAIQTSNEVQKYAYRGFKSACVYGGAPKGQQIRQLREGVKIVVGTPGRINDFINNNILNLSRVTYLVLDEADVMLDMGFEPQIRNILERIPKNRQTIMTSATWPEEAKELARQYLTNPIQINVGEMDLVAAVTIKQIIQFDQEDEYSREEHLKQFLSTLDPNREKVLIFVNTKDGAKILRSNLSRSRFKAETIHGNLDQYQREQALDALKENRVNILTATDVAARGLDISGITYVVNFNMPNNIEDYVHRIGRTGRAGKEGTAISYFTRENASMAKKLISILRKSNQTIDPRLYEMTNIASSNKQEKSRYGYRGAGGGYSNQFNNNYYSSRNNNSNYYGGGGAQFGRNYGAPNQGFRSNQGFRNNNSNYNGFNYNRGGANYAGGFPNNNNNTRNFNDYNNGSNSYQPSSSSSSSIDGSHNFKREKTGW